MSGGGLQQMSGGGLPPMLYKIAISPKKYNKNRQGRGVYYYLHRCSHWDFDFIRQIPTWFASKDSQQFPSLGCITSKPAKNVVWISLRAKKIQHFRYFTGQYTLTPYIDAKCYIQPTGIPATPPQHCHRAYRQPRHTRGSMGPPPACKNHKKTTPEAPLCQGPASKGGLARYTNQTP